MRRGPRFDLRLGAVGRRRALPPRAAGSRCRGTDSGRRGPNLVEVAAAAQLGEHLVDPLVVLVDVLQQQDPSPGGPGGGCGAGLMLSHLLQVAGIESVVIADRRQYFREYPFAWFGILCQTPPSAPELITPLDLSGGGTSIPTPSRSDAS